MRFKNVEEIKTVLSRIEAAHEKGGRIDELEARLEKAEKLCEKVIAENAELKKLLLAKSKKTI